MKKVFLLLVCALFTLTSFSQEFKKVQRMTVISYDEQKGDWVDDRTTYPQTLYVKIKGSEIIITSDYQQRIYTYGNVEENNYTTHVTYTWSALDKDDKPCKFIMKHFKTGEIIYMFIYNGVGVEYLMEN